MEYMTFSGPTLNDAAEIALKNRLYVAGWSLRKNLMAVSALEKRKKGRTQIVIGFKGVTPVSVAMFSANTRGRVFVMLYVKPQYRRKGIATNMIELWRKNYKCKKFVAFLGVEGSEAFFKKIGDTTIYYFGEDTLPEKV